MNDVEYGLSYKLDIGQPLVEEEFEKFEDESKREEKIRNLCQRAIDQGGCLKITDLSIWQGNHGIISTGFIPFYVDLDKFILNDIWTR